MVSKALALPAQATPKRTRDRSAQLVGLAALLFLAAYAVGLAARPSEGFLRIQSNVFYNLPALAALVLVIVPLRRSRGRARLGWACLALLLVAWQVADWTFSYYALILNGDPPFPGFADVAYYIGYFAFIAAVPLLTFSEGRFRDRRWVIDATIVMIVAGAISWEYVMKPIAQDSGGDYFAAAVGLGYPLLDLALLVGLLVTLYAAGGKLSRRALLLSAAALCQIAADGGYSYVVTTVGYDNVGNPLELGWLAAYALLAVCFVLPDEPAETRSLEQPSLVGIALPYASAVPLLALFITQAIVGQPSGVLLGGAAGAVGLVVGRQFLTLRTNLSLLIHAANYDELTGLPSRRRFAEELGQHVRRLRADRHGGALLRLGVDDLKAVNDSLGHQGGDEVIVRIGHLLREQFGEGDRLARLGGDEFAVLIPDADWQAAQRAAQQLLRVVRERPVVFESHILRTTATVGVALLPDHGTTVDELFANTDLAMYEAKAAGGNDVRLFDPASSGQAAGEARLLMKQRIREALEHDLFVLYGQPIVDLRAGNVHEYELLIRMPDADGQLLAPIHFLPIAERFGLIHSIDRWVLRYAIRLLAANQRRGDHTRFAVNLSGKAFDDHGLLTFIEEQLATAAVDPSGLTLEVTETAAISDLDRAQAFITRLQRTGCQFALDDFGVGFSSFLHLKQLPVDYLKIDGSFVRDLPRNEVDQQLVKAIVEVARALGKRTVAEFVEDEETVQLLRELGVDYGQGYHLGRPAPVIEAAAALDAQLQRVA